MAKRRWQPPPMNTPTKRDEPDTGMRVDEQVVRRVLKVNPDLREGRTTLQVKKALERGESLHGGASGGGASGSSSGSGLGRQAASSASAARPSNAVSARQLSETLDFFMTSKGRELSGQLDEIAARRQTLEEEERQLRAEVRQKLIDFVAMLDAGVLALHGREALQAHRELLARVGMTASELLNAVKGGSR